MARKREMASITSESLNELKAARLAKNLTQEEMAENMGCTRATYSRMENGHTAILSENWNKACNLVDMHSYVCLVPKDQQPVDIGKLMKELQEKDSELERMKGQIAEMKEHIKQLSFSIELLKENRELRKG